jgi:hypothetical protein
MGADPAAGRSRCIWPTTRDASPATLLAGAIAGALGSGQHGALRAAAGAHVLVCARQPDAVALGLYLMAVTRAAGVQRAFGQKLWRHLQPLSAAFLPARTVVAGVSARPAVGLAPLRSGLQRFATALSSGSGRTRGGLDAGLRRWAPCPICCWPVCSPRGFRSSRATPWYAIASGLLDSGFWCLGTGRCIGTRAAGLPGMMILPICRRRSHERSGRRGSRSRSASQRHELCRLRDAHRKGAEPTARRERQRQPGDRACAGVDRWRPLRPRNRVVAAIEQGRLQRAAANAGTGHRGHELRGLLDALEKVLNRLPGVEAVVNLASERATVRYLPGVVAPALLFATIERRASADASPMTVRARTKRRRKSPSSGLKCAASGFPPLLTLPLAAQMLTMFDGASTRITRTSCRAGCNLLLATPVQFWIGWRFYDGRLEGPARRRGEHGRAGCARHERWPTGSAWS